MKKALFILLSLAVAAFVYSAISGTGHDFSAESWTTNGEICLPCHTPHNGDASVSGAPLWNHEVSTSTYTLYPSGGTMNAVPTAPTGVSLLCLSCHDGSVALDSFGGATGTENITGGALFGTDLSNDHPISFDYTTALATADGELHNPSVANSGLGGTIAADMLFSNSLECASCHDVHDGNDLGPTGHLLIKSNANSALCLTCHDK